MEPFSILGAAAAVAQFVDFSTRVIIASADVFESAKGSAARNQVMENITSALSNISDELSTPGGDSTERFSLSPQSSQEQAAKSLRILSKQCHEDCEELLKVLKKLKVNRGIRYRRWKSIKAGLATVWESRKIEDFEKRLEATQRTMILHITKFVR